MTQPEQFGRYLLLKSLGHGGMGEVWLARDTTRDEDAPKVAVKRIAEEHSRKPAFEKRFSREAAALYHLDTHPNIVRVNRFGEIDGRLYLEMETVEGRSLRDRLREGRFDPHEAVDILEQLARGLVAVHARGLEHRDVKPENILLSNDPEGHLRVVLVDFGIVAMGTVGQPGVTASGEIVGSPWYVAPERWAGPPRPGWIRRRPPRTGAMDVYSCGVVLFEMLTGRTPFQGDVDDLGAAHVYGDRPRATAVRSDLPSAFDAVIARAMARDPRDRYRDANALADAVRSAARGRRPFPARRVATGVVAVAVIAGVAIGVDLSFSRTPPLQVAAPVDIGGPVAGPVAVAVGPDGPRAFVADQSGGIVVVDLKTHRTTGLLPPDPTIAAPEPATEIVASPDGNEVYVSANGTVTAIDAVTLAPKGSHPLPEAAKHLTAGGSATDSPLYAASTQGTAVFTLGINGYALVGSEAAPTSVAVDPASGSAYGLYPSGNGARIDRITSGGQGVPVATVPAEASAIAVTSDGSVAVAIGGTLIMVDPGDGRSTPVPLPPGGTIRGLSVSKDELYVLTDGGQLSLVTDDEVATSVSGLPTPAAVAVGPDSECSAVVSPGSSIVTVVSEGARCAG